MPDKANTLLVDSIQKLLRRKADRNLQRILHRTHAADIAGVMRQLTDADRTRLFGLIPDVELQGEVLAEADREIQLALVERAEDEELLEILKEMYGDDAADIIELLDEERAEKVLRALSGEEGPDVDVLLGYDPDSAGGIMSTEVFALPHNTTVSEAIETLQSSHEELEMAFYLYVVNEHGHLVGVCSLRQLVVSDASATLNEVMASDVISVTTDTDQEFVARIVARYNFLAVPVVDANNRLVGLVTVDDVIDVIREEATEDMLRLVGAGADLDDQTSAMKSTGQRMPWLAASFVGGLGSMFIINRYEASIQQIAALASFIPVILGMGGNVGTQAATIVTRGLALGRINSSQFLSVISREIATGAMLGLVYGAVLAVFIALFQGSPDVGQIWQPWQLACTVSLGIITCMVLAATVGGGYPLLFDRLGIDPAIAAGPFVTTTIDVVGILAYFLIAKFFLPL